MIKKIIKKVVGEKNIKKLQNRIEKKRLLERELLFEEKSELESLRLSNLIMAHSIEKSMAIRNIASLTNLTRYENVINNSMRLLQRGIGRDDYAICVPLRTVATAMFFILENKLSKDEERIRKIIHKVEELEQKYGFCYEGATGIGKININQMSMGRNFDWEMFSTTRHSVRKFTNRIVERAVVEKIINGAKYYPSACNRQPCKVYFSVSDDKNIEIAAYVNDAKTVKDNIHNFLIVTCDRNCFMSGELYQNYINGGIYLGYLLLSIHSQGLGGCIFQYIQNNKRDVEFHKKFNIPMNENIIAFIGYGYLEEESIILCAPRKETNEVAIEIE